MLALRSSVLTGLGFTGCAAFLATGCTPKIQSVRAAVNEAVAFETRRADWPARIYSDDGDIPGAVPSTSTLHRSELTRVYRSLALYTPSDALGAASFALSQPVVPADSLTVAEKWRGGPDPRIVPQDPAFRMQSEPLPDERVPVPPCPYVYLARVEVEIKPDAMFASRTKAINAAVERLCIEARKMGGDGIFDIRVTKHLTGLFGQVSRGHRSHGGAPSELLLADTELPEVPIYEPVPSYYQPIPTIKTVYTVVATVFRFEDAECTE